MTYPTPHKFKLIAALNNKKMPESDKPQIEETMRRYESWIELMEGIEGTPRECLKRLVVSFNEYKNFVDLDLIFDSPNDFLYRQKGQLKLDNTIIEEFLPRLLTVKVIPELSGHGLYMGPTTAYSSISFESNIHRQPDGGGMTVNNKDQDFAIAKKLFLKSSNNPNFSNSITEETYLAYVAAECKTNLDKTMFQEASATAHNLKTSIVGAKYYLICEWLDMIPVSTATTDIDEVLVLRKSMRLGSNVRSNFSSVKGRRASRNDFKQYLESNPYDIEVFQRLCDHISRLFPDNEEDVLTNGYF